jgi:SAM-dependent methyltransferase
VANEAEVKKWNDIRQTSTWPAREQITGAVSPYLLDAITVRAGTRILDVGCGGGGLTSTLAERVGSTGEVVGVDISDALLTLAAERSVQACVDNVEFLQLDMQSGHVGGGPFDLAVSQFGVMLFDEPAVAFANICSHLVPDGHLAFACWQPADRNPWHVSAALGPLVAKSSAPAPGKSATGPFTLGDPEHVTSLLRAAGFDEIAVVPHECAAVGSSSAIYDARLLEFMGVAPEHMDEAAAAVGAHLSRFRVAGDEFAFPLAFQVVTANRH